ncbi:hypothetical protein BV25DRAFT_1823420 [Artomyces pyxidatus]|uniref:Uncharacterized protein n=1 Tax=Artomyces pyxidatus TaxID=48021 RepID=A0ACB8T8S1_9AGAM|nr:hypothetical protein BV25DRAFT_1823420 [Artomyces pyxidatus]
MQPDPIYDLKDGAEFPPSTISPFHNRVIIRNDPSIFLADKEHGENEDEDGPSEPRDEGNDQEESNKEEDDEEYYSPLSNMPISRAEIDQLHMYPLMMRRVTQQTGKGKIARMYSLVVVGNGNGLVGYGESKDEEVPRATDKAYIEAVRNMDYVDRFEQRTIWTEMQGKLGATQIILRPRPVGFGLHCNPNIHQVLKAAGIKDISAKVWGSRNPLNVIKLLFRMLHAGNAPLAMGNGIGGGGRKLDKGSGVRGKQEIERERGRKLVNLRTW